MSDEIRVLIAEDSPTIRHYLTTLIEEAPGMRVIGTAQDGEEVLRLVHELRPDVVSMDISMPGMDGLEATRRVMTTCPTPVVVVSGLVDREVDLSLRALEAGALAVVGKPPDRANPSFPAIHQQLLNTLRAMSSVSVVARRERLQLAPATRRPTSEQVAAPMPRLARPELVVVGASTGGPSALHRLLQGLPPDFPLPLVIVQHMPSEFIDGLVRWLNRATPLEVVVAQAGLPLEPGLIAISPGTTAHTIVRRQAGRLVIAEIDEIGGHRHQPSVDVLFESAAAVCGASAIGVVLTGMGDDGAAGLLALRQAGAHTFAQDETSSTVFGMPAAAIALGAVERVEPLTHLASEIVKLL